jgi:hypothetical protein
MTDYHCSIGERAGISQAGSGWVIEVKKEILLFAVPTEERQKGA